MRVLYVNPMEGEVNPAIDTIAYGLQHSLDNAGIDVRMLVADFRDPDCPARTAAAIQAGIDARVDGIAFYALDPSEPAEAVAAARAAGIPVFTFVRPYFPVNVAVLYPNFNHGVLMAEWLSERLPTKSRVAIIGGPDTPDDAEEVAGLLYAFRRSGVTVANDPTDPTWCNLTDVTSGGEEVTIRVLAQHEPLHGLVPYNDETMLGAIAAFDKVGRPDDLSLISRNGSPPAVAEVGAGRLQGTWDLDASGIGTTLGDLIVRHLTVGSDGRIPRNQPGRADDPRRQRRDVAAVDRTDQRAVLHLRNRLVIGVAMRVLYINAMDYGANAGVDTIAHGLAHRLAQDGIEIRVIYTDFRQPDWREAQARAVRDGTKAGVDAIVVYVLDPDHPADAVAEARAAGIPVFSLERPHFAYDGCAVFPNFNHGAYMAEHLATLLPGGADVGLIGGPDVVDDIELLLGLQHGLRTAGLNVVNDPSTRATRTTPT